MSSPSGLRSAPIASGTLSGVPLAHALVYIRNKRLSGVLELRATAERHAWLAFWRGLVVSSMTTPTVARFGTVVYELGMIDGATLDESTIESAKSKRPQMDVLLERGAITSAQRDEVLIEQARRRVHHLFTLPPATTFTFREGSPSTSEPSIAVDVLAPVWRGLCDFPPDGRSAEVLARVGNHPLRLVSEAVMERAELKPAEVALLEALARKPMTLGQMRVAAALPAARVDLLAYLLVITRCVEVEGAARAPLPSAAMWAAATASRNPASNQGDGGNPGAGGAAAGEAGAAGAEAERPVPSTSTDRLTAAAHAAAVLGPEQLGVAGIKRRAAGLATETPFATLGLVEGASPEAARAAFFRLGKLWHPDRLPAGLENVRADAERIYAHMTQAHRLLTDPKARPAVVSR
ncbi:MAG: DnaJ-class molecular chaperone CbpA [Myxococcaceae bacterium]|nr:DnaJ-class molecular chaperone CbpA [Myxococcaceae bacterium]